MVLVHGLGNGPIFMRPISLKLAKNGFEPLIVSYSMRHTSLLEHRNLVKKFVRTHSLSQGDYYLVAHSYGALLSRHCIYRAILPYPAAAVFLSPVTRPSSLARWWVNKFSALPKGREIFRFLLGEIIELLAQDDLLEQVPVCPELHPLGVIIARLPKKLRINPILPPLPNDGTLLLEETLPDTADEVAFIPCEHTTLLLHPKTAELVVRFLLHGTFGTYTASEARNKKNRAS